MRQLQATTHPAIYDKKSWHEDTTVYYFYLFYLIMYYIGFGWFWLWCVLQCFCLLKFFWCPCMAIYICVQYNSGLLPDIILLTQYYYHRGIRLDAMNTFLSSQPMIPPKRFDIFPPVWDTQKA